MTTWWFRMAGGLCVLGVAAHEVPGAPMVLPPLQETGLANPANGALWGTPGPIPVGRGLHRRGTGHLENANRMSVR